MYILYPKFWLHKSVTNVWDSIFGSNVALKTIDFTFFLFKDSADSNVGFNLMGSIFSSRHLRGPSFLKKSWIYWFPSRCSSRLALETEGVLSLRKPPTTLPEEVKKKIEKICKKNLFFITGEQCGKYLMENFHNFFSYSSQVSSAGPTNWNPSSQLKESHFVIIDWFLMN